MTRLRIFSKTDMKLSAIQIVYPDAAYEMQRIKVLASAEPYKGMPLKTLTIDEVLDSDFLCVYRVNAPGMVSSSVKTFVSSPKILLYCYYVDCLRDKQLIPMTDLEECYIINYNMKGN